ncbi:MAG TPA: tetratricopeptide repeat protein, partial [Candidatus Obscuribacterales bacterium]
MKLTTRLALFLSILVGGLVLQGAGAQTTNQHAISMYNLGLNAYKQGSSEAAIIFFRRACDIDPNLADAQYNLGMLYQAQRRIKEAVPRFQEVLRVKPMDPDAHYQLALCFLELNRGVEARQHLASIPPSNPHFSEAQRKMQVIDSQPGAASGAISSATTQLAPLIAPAGAAPEMGGRIDSPGAYAQEGQGVTQYRPDNPASPYVPATAYPAAAASTYPPTASSAPEVPAAATPSYAQPPSQTPPETAPPRYLPATQAYTSPPASAPQTAPAVAGAPAQAN